MSMYNNIGLIIFQKLQINILNQLISFDMSYVNQ